MTEQKVNNGPAVTFNDFSSLFQSIKSWNHYTPETIERGALNYITPKVTKSATHLVTTGEVVIMGLAWNTVAGPDNQKPALHYMSEIGDTPNEEPTCNKDFIGVDYHGKAVSHLDAMTHIAFQDILFGGKKSSEVVNATGSAWATVDKLGPIVTRGVILDAARFAGEEWIEPGTAIHADDILAYEKKFGFTIGQGDCVLLRSGHFARRDKLGVWDPSDFSAGFNYLKIAKLVSLAQMAIVMCVLHQWLELDLQFTCSLSQVWEFHFLIISNLRQLLRNVLNLIDGHLT
jgi:hypothetical protein